MMPAQKSKVREKRRMELGVRGKMRRKAEMVKNKDRVTFTVVFLAKQHAYIALASPVDISDRIFNTYW